MKIDILTLFPKMFSGPFDESIIKRAKEKGQVEINLHDLRQWAVDVRGSVDDRPYGGGAGMIIRVDVVSRALMSIAQSSKCKVQSKVKSEKPKGGEAINIDSGSPVPFGTGQAEAGMTRVILLTPQGRVFDQEKARELSKLDRIVLICGHYEGFDERIREHLVDEELSIGEYVLTGGELPAMVVTDAVTRLIPGVLLKQEATQFESFSTFNDVELKVQNAKCKAIVQSSKTNSSRQARRIKKYIEYPQYTRPEEFNGWKVPKILLSGNHKEIEKWRTKQAGLKTSLYI